MDNYIKNTVSRKTQRGLHTGPSQKMPTILAVKFQACNYMVLHVTGSGLLQVIVIPLTTTPVLSFACLRLVLD